MSWGPVRHAREPFIPGGYAPERYTRYWLPERVLRTILISSTAVVVVVIENRARKAFSEPGRPCTPPVSG